MFDAIFPKHWTTLQRLMWLKTNALARAVYETITGNPVSFTARNAPLRQLKVAFSPVQSGTGDPSPDNVRPISGWSEVTVEQRGKNLSSIATVTSQASTTLFDFGRDITISEITFSMDVDGTIWSTTGGWLLDFKKADGTHGYKSVTGVAGSAITAGTAFTGHLSKTYTNETFRYLLLSSWNTTASTVNFSNIQVELSGTETAYTPYNPLSRSISISLGSTVYSGYVDVISGVGEVTMGKIVLDGTQTSVLADWRSTSTSVGAIFNFPWQSLNIDQVGAGDKALGISDSLVAESYNNVFDNKTGTDASFALGYASGQFDRIFIRLPDTTLTTKDLLLAYLTAHPITIVYKLKTTIPISLTPQEVQSLLGVNNLWSNANQPITVEYRSN